MNRTKCVFSVIRYGHNITHIFNTIRSIANDLSVSKINVNAGMQVRRSYSSAPCCFTMSCLREYITPNALITVRYLSKPHTSLIDQQYSTDLV